MSTFGTNHIHSLILSTVPDVPSSSDSLSSSNSQLKLEFFSLLLALKPPFEKTTIRATLNTLNEVEHRHVSSASLPGDSEEQALKQALVGRILVGLYAEVLDLCLKEASEADAEAEWWRDIERSWGTVAWYLLQTLPERFKRGLQTVVDALRSHNIPLRPSSFTPGSFRRLFPPSLRPSAFTAALFPHLSQQSHTLFTSPVELARQECRTRIKNLETLRNERAEALGRIFAIKMSLGAHLDGDRVLDDAVLLLKRQLSGKADKSNPPNVISSLHSLAFTQVPEHISAHNYAFASLRRPSRLTLMWPRLVLLPPASWILFRLAYGSRQSISETMHQALETLKGFWFGYVIEPIRGILDTVRTGGDDGARIVSTEGVKADLESLERMALALSKDKLSYGPVQLEALSEQIRHGDLTPVLRIYEEDIKTPIRSVFTGSLVRSLLIQIQKAKVDIDQALSGIDKLLKSQELTFGFVGVAPALAVVYVTLGYIRGIWVGGRGSSRFGGKKRRERTWLAMRRIERLLINQPHRVSETLSPLTSGLLLISIAHLRTYAETCLPVRSRLREGFLEDVADLESQDLGRREKQKVVDRMWRSWAVVLGWQDVGGFRRS